MEDLHLFLVIFKVAGVGLQYLLSNDPDKNCSIFYCSAAICFSHIEIVVFHTENISTDGKQVYEIKCI